MFARLGCTAFGGPPAHIALFEAELVRRRGWLDRTRFLDLLAIANLVPGPTSTELAIHLGFLRAGWAGLLVAGAAFILPSAVLVSVLAWAYVQWGRLPVVDAVVEALRPAVMIVVAAALRPLATSALGRPQLVGAAAVALLLALVGVSEVTCVLGALVLGLAFGPALSGRLAAVPLLELAWVFGKIGATLLGSGYLLIAYLQDELGARGWLDAAAIVDAVAIGQITPGPILTTATFVGFLLAGWPGAVVATVAIFVPSFVFVAVSGPLLSRWRDDVRVRAALDVVNAVVVGLIAAVLMRLMPVAMASAFQIVVAAAAAGALFGLRASGGVVLLGAVIAGLVRWALG